jgi:hypothetical protein
VQGKPSAANSQIRLLDRSCQQCKRNDKFQFVGVIRKEFLSTNNLENSFTNRKALQMANK